MKRTLLTGASGGIGQAVARRLAAEGRPLYLHYNSNQAAVAALKKECEETYGVSCDMIQADLSTHDGAACLIEQLNAPVDTLIHNAGQSPYGIFTDVTPEEMQQTMQLHLTSAMQLTQALLPMMLQSRSGQIIVMSSVWGEAGASCEVLYATVKGGLNTFVRSLAKECAVSGIRVNGVAPGVIETSMMDQFSADERSMLQEEIPAGRLGRPEDVAGAVKFLLSEDAGYIHGHILPVSGAWVV
ncbi:3-oxoacyl-[acyl-carrier protein] reductase [Salsuginibacillus halophilus]|uniref:3-oxoacyl-[acyl-carrier protein] reductase n=1 Tax=Salsuginibacillus halophilus TaxID=517424 RepID=A0A2P8HYG1_9BACI|nr:SDR family oxidoreductase [Salsuginibacillus halophilus]PSL51250.1 3-oxoacyl-[acyl-carrier protein] reductase [Salsuginibacillus halophilus]